ncbi:MAG: phospholipid carrier-dependent glycosyltransferase [Deltaproteobacteria bacterium]|nr:phospholipid carrier-dependent glycosyltransferase [Deltaproteobacteria bacterium]
MPAHTRLEHLGLWVLAAALYAWISPDGLLYWDSFGYVSQCAQGQVGGLMLGRPLFVLLGHTIARITGLFSVDLAHLEPTLRAVCTLTAALSAPLTAALALSLGTSRAASRWAGLVVAASPAIAHAAGAVLTDGPALSATLAALCVAQRAQHARHWLFAGALFALSVGLREPSISFGSVLVAIACAQERTTRVRALLLISLGFLLLAVPTLAWCWGQPGWRESVLAWRVAMARERLEPRSLLRDGAIYLGWLFALGPVALFAALRGWSQFRALLGSWREARFWVCTLSLAQLILLAFYQDISFSPRYLMAAFPGAIALVAGLVLAQVRTRAVTVAWVAAVLAPALIAGPVLRRREAPLRSVIDSVPARLAHVATDTVIVTGQACPAVQLRRTIERIRLQNHSELQPRWVTVCPGWSWPNDLSQALAAHCTAGRPVLVDLRPQSYVGERQQRALATLTQWAERVRSDPREVCHARTTRW